MAEGTEFDLPDSAHTLFRWLIGGKLPLNRLWQKRAYRWKFLVRSLLLSNKTFIWLEALQRYPLLRYYLGRQTNLPCKLQHPYLTAVMCNKDRLAALIYHYDLFSGHPGLTRACYNDTPFTLAQITGKNDELLTIAIQAEDRYAREGELTLYFYDADQTCLTSMTFTLLEYCGKSTLFISCLQGNRTENIKTRISQATKSCHGLFPKRILLETCRALADYFQLEQLIAVSNDTHIYNNWRYRHRRASFFSDYDNFWRSLEGQPLPEGYYLLPRTTARKSMDEIPSKKRAEYRRRYALLDTLTETVKARLHEHDTD